MICVDGDQQSLGSLSELSLRDITDIQGQHNTNWLCGRTTETLTLLKTYETILQNPNRPLSKAVLVVHGESGSGKTSLVELAARTRICQSWLLLFGEILSADGRGEAAFWSRRNPIPPFSLPFQTFVT
jgi:hypothetical protein